MSSLYWDDFERRISETVSAVSLNLKPPVRRVAIFITNRCNLRCHYCNVNQNEKTLSEEAFNEVINRYGREAIIHITGGEPSVVPWLYSYIENRKDVRFHLNTNAYLTPPKNIKRLKVSLDTQYKDYFNFITGVKFNAFDSVVENIRCACENTVVSITYTLTKENYKDSVRFAKWALKQFPGLYAVFFSVYKGNNKRFKLDDLSVKTFFNQVLPSLKKNLNPESLELINETIDEKFRLMQGVRFPENKKESPCYISMSERVASPSGEMFRCSHLYRDSIHHKDSEKHDKCLYGCNRRLVSFNEEVERRIKC